MREFFFVKQISMKFGEKAKIFSSLRIGAKKGEFFSRKDFPISLESKVLKLDI